MGDSLAESDSSKAADIFVAWLKGFCVATAFLMIDPFGLSQGADRLSEQVILSITAPLLSKPPSLSETLRAQAEMNNPPLLPIGVRPATGKDRSGQEKVTVILIDDAFMKRYNAQRPTRATWPISRTDQYDLIFEPILDKQPAALFIDYVFHADSAEPVRTNALRKDQPQTDLDGLVDTLRTRLALDPATRKTRILLAERPARVDADTRQGCSFRVTDDFQLAWDRHASAKLNALAGDQASNVELVATRYWGPPDRYPLAPLALHTAGDVPKDCDPFKPGEQLIVSPALALYLSWCRIEQRQDGLCSSFEPEKNAAAGHIVKVSGFRIYQQQKTAQPLTASVPQWLWYPSDVMRNVLLAPAEAKSNRPGQRLPPCVEVDRQAISPWPDGPWLVQASGFFRALRFRLPGTGDEEVRYNRCIAIDTISALALGRLEGGLNDKALSALLTNRLVLVGVDLEAARDVVSNPVNGQVPGVLLHATVLENLISDGEERSRESPNFFGGIPAGTVFALLLAAVTAFPLSRLALQRGWTSWQKVLLLTVFSLLLPLVLATKLYSFTNFAPANWVSPLAAKLTMLGDFGRLLERSPFARAYCSFSTFSEKMHNHLKYLMPGSLLILAVFVVVFVVAMIGIFL